MVNPNPDTVLFCDWLTSSGYYRFSPQRLSLIAIIRAAAVAGTTVTNVQYNDFVRFTGHLYAAYLEYSFFSNPLPDAGDSNRKKILFDNTTHTSHAGVTQYILYNGLIPANTFDINDSLYFLALLAKTGTTYNSIFKAYLSPISNDYTAGQMIAQSTIQLTNVSALWNNYLFNKNSLSAQESFTNLLAAFSPFTQSSGSISTYTIDFSVNQYFIITSQRTTGGVTDSIHSISVYLDKG
jgi:hypothetical protein